MNPRSSCLYSCDWGTSSFRLRLVRTEDGGIIEEVASALGAKALASHLAPGADTRERAAAFDDYLSGQLEAMAARHPESAVQAPVIVSGMASSSVGWRELPYATVPFPVDGSGARVERLELTRRPSGAHPMWLVSGLTTATDMMRGEETELIGIFALPDMDALARRCRIVLPGTHSKHIEVTEGQIVNFQTYMTGELFQVLTEHSVLRFTTGAGDGDPDLEAFQEGVETARDSGLPRSLFRARSKAVLDGRPGTANRGFLSGLLIGAELRELQEVADDTPVVLAAAGALGPPYRLAGEILGLGGRVRHLDAGQMKRVVALGHRQLLRQRFR